MALRKAQLSASWIPAAWMPAGDRRPMLPALITQECREGLRQFPEGLPVKRKAWLESPTCSVQRPPEQVGERSLPRGQLSGGAGTNASGMVLGVWGDRWKWKNASGELSLMGVIVPVILYWLSWFVCLSPSTTPSAP